MDFQTNRWLVLTVAGGLLLMSSCAGGGDESPVIATVGEVSLTVDALVERIPDEILMDATRDEIAALVNQWIRGELLYQEAKTRGYEKDPRVVQRVRDATRDIVVDAYLEDELDLREFVTDGEIGSYFEHNQDSFRRTVDAARYRALWFPDRARAARARSALSAGRAFQEIEADTSFGVTGAHLLGDFVDRGVLGDALESLVFRQTAGTVSQPLALEDSYLIIQLLEISPEGAIRGLPEVREEILSRLLHDLREMKMDELLGRLLQSAEVGVDLQSAVRSLNEGIRP